MKNQVTTTIDENELITLALNTMNIKYRIKRYNFPIHPSPKSFYVAQYRVLGIWLNININGNGNFLKTNNTICETINEAKKRITLFKTNIERSKNWADKRSDIVWREI